MLEIILIALVVVTAILVLGGGNRKQKQPADPVVMQLTPTDAIHLHQIHEGCMIFGAIGSGKTSGPGDELARRLLQLGVGFCVLTAKPSEFDRWKKLCEQTGRSKDLVRFGPGSGIKCDLLNYALSHPEDTVESTAALLAILIEMQSRSSEGRGDEPFWKLSSEKHLRRAIHAVWRGMGKASLTDIYQFITSSAQSPGQAASAEWLGNAYCARCLNEMLTKYPKDYDATLTTDYWMKEWPNLSDKTKSVVHAMTTNVLDKFLFGELASMISSGETNFTPEDIANGAVCVLDMSYLRWRDPGRFFQVLFKTLVQRAILRRDVAQSHRPVCIWQDEGQIFVTDQDVQVQAVARESRLISVFITQSLPVLYEALGGGPKAEQMAKALIGNLQTKVLCQQGDSADTNPYFSSLMGSSRHLFCSSSTNTGPYDLMSDVMGLTPNTGSASANEQWFPDVPPEQFTYLKKGGKGNNYIVEAIVFQGGRLFSNGKTWVRASFKQRP